LIAFLALNLFGSLVGCAQHDEKDPDEDALLLAPRPHVDYAKGWDALIVRAGISEVTIDTSAHFKVDPNNCRQVDYGPIRIQDWNAVALALNRAAALPTLEKEKCFRPEGEERGAFDGWAEVRITPGSAPRRILQAEGGDICAYFDDETAARQLVSALNSLLPVAWVEGCTL
jgi:hypothetical protein